MRPIYFFAMAFLSNCAPLVAQFSNVINLPPAPNLGDNQEIVAGTQLNLGPGGSVGAAFDAWSGSEINISGGEVGDFFHIHSGATANISGGITAGIVAENGSFVTLSGGAIGDKFHSNRQSSVRIFGGDFLIDGIPIEGLVNEGDAVTVQVPFDTLLSGVLADGTPFAFVQTKGIYLSFDPYDTFTIVLSELPDPGPAVIDLSTSPTPSGARSGQTLIVRDGAVLGKNFTAVQGSTILVQENGAIEHNLEIVNSSVHVSGGIIHGDFDALAGSTVSISSGIVREVVLVDSVLTVSDGFVGFNYQGPYLGNAIYAKENSTVNVLGGTVGSGVSVGSNSVLNVLSGSIGDNLDVLSGASINISGGVFGEKFNAFQGSHVNIFGTEFYLDGVPITDLSYDSPTLLLVRDQVLSGTLSDGTSFDFLLSSDNFLNDYFDDDAALTLTLVHSSGDFDGDGDVDGRDFLLWQRNPNVEVLIDWQSAYGDNTTSPSQGDFDNDGDADGRDFLVWQHNQNVGTLADWQAGYGSLSSAVTAVPEPSSLILVFLLGSVLISRCRV